MGIIMKILATKIPWPHCNCEMRYRYVSTCIQYKSSSSLLFQDHELIIIVISARVTGTNADNACLQTQVLFTCSQFLIEDYRLLVE